MNSSLEDELANTSREYARVRRKAEKSRNPEAVKKIKQAQKLLEKAENEADKTMDPRLTEKATELFKKLRSYPINSDT